MMHGNSKIKNHKIPMPRKSNYDKCSVSFVKGTAYSELNNIKAQETTYFC